LARIKTDLGTSGTQEVQDQIKETENLDNTGNYTEAVKSAADLINVIDRMDTGALNKDSLENIRTATRDLGKVIANLPLPFGKDNEKLRYSDLPPALRSMIDTFIKKVNTKIGTKDAADATKLIRDFKSGARLFTQAEVSSELNKMLRLLT